MSTRAVRFQLLNLAGDGCQLSRFRRLPQYTDVCLITVSVLPRSLDVQLQVRYVLQQGRPPKLFLVWQDTQNIVDIENPGCTFRMDQCDWLLVREPHA